MTSSVGLSVTFPVIQGDLRLNDSDYYVGRLDKGGLKAEVARWHGEPSQPFVSVDVYSEESMAACEFQHRPECDRYMPGSWGDIHPTVSDFPRRIPLRLFFNAEGGYKNHGDTIKLQNKSQLILLTCKGVKGSENDFAQILAKKVAVSLSVNMFKGPVNDVPFDQEEWVYFSSRQKPPVVENAV